MTMTRCERDADSPRCRDRRSPAGTAAPPTAPPTTCGTTRTNTAGFVSTRRGSGDGVYVISEENDCSPMPWHYARQRELRARDRRRRVRIAGGCAATSRSSTRTRDSCASPATRLASSTSSAVRAPSPSSASTRRSAPGFDEIATVPTFTVTPAMALTHLRLLRGQRLGADDVTLESLALDLLSAALEQHHDGITSYSRRTTGESRRRLVTEACELLASPRPQGRSRRDRPRRSAARRTTCRGCSTKITGLTIPQYRKRLRVHDALRRLNDGEHDLAAIAVASGFADHSHMTRSFVAHYGDPPSRSARV